MSGRDIIFLVAAPNWKKAGLMPRLKKAVRAALLAAGGKKDVSLTILFGDDARLKALNRDFRGKNKPTNVLSFPAGPGPYLGDIAIAYGVAAREARAQGKRFADHAAHLVVHGVLHLLGFDHERAADAKVMEQLEAKILARLGIADPYLKAAP
jgi:probable rRNA maturation factor